MNDAAPKSVKVSVLLYRGTMAADLLFGILGPAPAHAFPNHAVGISISGYFLMLALNIGIFCFVVYMSYRGHNWGRWALLVFAIWRVLAFIPFLSSQPAPPVVSTAAIFFVAMIQLAAVLLLFRPVAQTRFKANRAAAKVA